MRALSDGSIKDFDLALFSGVLDDQRGRRPRFAEAGAVVMDNSSFWRMKEDVPLVVAEVNPEALDDRGMVSNLLDVQMVVALKPILDAAGIERLVISTYQSVSGTGQRAVEELHDQALAVLGPTAAAALGLPHQIAFNVLPQVETFKEGDDYTTEAQDDGRDAQDPRRAGRIGILGHYRARPGLGHSESINVETRDPLSPEVPRPAVLENRRHRG